MAGRANGGGNGGKGGGGGGGSAASSAASAFLAGVNAWCDTQPPTVAAMRDHLLAMDGAMGKAADSFHKFAATSIVAQHIHPAVAQPIDAAADQIASIRHNFTEAYTRFETIYADRLAYERDSNRPKPKEEFWKDAG
jgi:hypothetical protein